jgi:hypothetical protein
MLYQGEKYVESKMLYSVTVCKVADLQICLIYMKIAHEVLAEIKKYNPVGAIFSAPIQTCPGAYPASYIMGTRSFPGVKWPGCGVGHQPPSNAEVKERV